MNTPSELEKKAAKLTEGESTRLEEIVNQLSSINRNKEFTEENLKTMQNVIHELLIFQDLFFNRLIGLIKRGYKLD
jgi:hypothetical protein